MDDLIADYCDGDLFKSHDLFASHGNAIQLIIYYDEVEPCNTLASHSGIKKLGKFSFLCCNIMYIYMNCITGMFYYTIGNLPPELRSSQRAIQLIACVTSPHIKEYGIQPILQPFIEDVNTLAQVHYRC